MDYKFSEIVIAAGLFYFAAGTVASTSLSDPSEKPKVIVVEKPAYMPENVTFVPVESVTERSRSDDSKGECLRKAIENSYNIRERGYNRGKEVEELQAYTGNRPPDPYCASAVCKLAGDCGITNPKSAWSPTVANYGRLVYKHASRHPELVSGTYPKQITNPLIMAIYTQSKNRVTHVGFALKTDGRMTRTGEFNTSGSRKGYGSSDGDGFHFLYRPNEQIYSLRDWL